MGHSRPKWAIPVTSAYPPRAAVLRTSRHFAFVPLTDIGREAGIAQWLFANGFCSRLGLLLPGAFKRHALGWTRRFNPREAQVEWNLR
jgi:hypothetical protein